jgi:hypothetical protein
MSAVAPRGREPQAFLGRPTGMTQTRTFAAVLLAGLALGLSGCGTEVAGDGSPASGSGTTVDPEADKPSISADTDRSSDTLGTMILNQKLDVTAAEYPLPDVPTQVEVSSIAELGEAYAVVPGIEDIVAELEGTTLEPGERIFAYTVNSCTTEDVSLVVQGNQVPMVVKGTALLRCAPPTTLVVWVVGDEIPADAKPAQAIQK